jgi:hypothetical protein
MATLERVRRSMDVEQTPQNKGLTLTLRLTAYDNGMLTLDGIPINDRGARAEHDGEPAGPEYDQVGGWVMASEVIARTISEFRRKVAAREREMSTDAA